MTNMIPYNNYNRLARSMWPFADWDELFKMPTTSDDGVFKMDVEDAGEAYVVTAHVPGVKKDEVDVELNEGRLSVSVNHVESDEQKAKNYLHKETSEWHATRGVYLKDAATTGISAKLAEGVLTINVPKQVEQNKVTKVSID